MPGNIASTVYGQQGNRWLPKDKAGALDNRLAVAELERTPTELPRSWHVIEVIVDADGIYAIVELAVADNDGLDLYPFGTTVAQVRAELIPREDTRSCPPHPSNASPTASSPPASPSSTGSTPAPRSTSPEL